VQAAFSMKLTKYILDAEACGRMDWEVFLCDLGLLRGSDDVQGSILYHHPRHMTNDYRLMKCGQLISTAKFHSNLFGGGGGGIPAVARRLSGSCTIDGGGNDKDGNSCDEPKSSNLVIKLSSGICQAHLDGDLVLFVVAKTNNRTNELAIKKVQRSFKTSFQLVREDLKQVLKGNGEEDDTVNEDGGNGDLDKGDCCNKAILDEAAKLSKQMMDNIVAAAQLVHGGFATWKRNSVLASGHHQQQQQQLQINSHSQIGNGTDSPVEHHTRNGNTVYGEPVLTGNGSGADVLIGSSDIEPVDQKHFVDEIGTFLNRFLWLSGAAAAAPAAPAKVIKSGGGDRSLHRHHSNKQPILFPRRDQTFIEMSKNLMVRILEENHYVLGGVLLGAEPKPPAFVPREESAVLNRRMWSPLYAFPDSLPKTLITWLASATVNPNCGRRGAAFEGCKAVGHEAGPNGGGGCDVPLGSRLVPLHRSEDAWLYLDHLRVERDWCLRAKRKEMGTAAASADRSADSSALFLRQLLTPSAVVQQTKEACYSLYVVGVCKLQLVLLLGTCANDLNGGGGGGLQLRRLWNFVMPKMTLINNHTFRM